MHESDDGIVTPTPENSGREVIGHVIDHARTDQRPQLTQPGNMLVQRRRSHSCPLRNRGKREPIDSELVDHTQRRLNNSGR
jgi:hypothetical protein